MYFILSRSVLCGSLKVTLGTRFHILPRSRFNCKILAISSLQRCLRLVRTL